LRFLGGALGGIIVGFLAGWIHGWLGAGLVGVLAMVPVVALIVVIESGHLDWNATIAVSAMLGFPVSVIGRVILLKIDPFGPIHR
jgi:hypothetical protein